MRVRGGYGPAHAGAGNHGLTERDTGIVGRLEAMRKYIEPFLLQPYTHTVEYAGILKHPTGKCHPVQLMLRPDSTAYRHHGIDDGIMKPGRDNAGRHPAVYLRHDAAYHIGKY